MSDSPTPRQRPRWKLSAIWLSGAAAAVVLVLGINGTLSDWSAAILTNTNDSVGTVGTVVLTETGPNNAGTATTCSTSGSPTNTADCTTINKYGDDGTLDTTLQPGDSVTTTVTFTNAGSGDGAAFTMTPAACTSVYNTGSNVGSAPALVDDLCTQLQVTVACTGPATLNVGPLALDAFATGGPYPFTNSLASGDATSCTFTVALPAATPANFSGQTVTQPIAWELDAA